MSTKHLRNVYVLSLYTALVGVGYSIFLTLFPLYILSLGYSMVDLGGITTLANLFVAIITPLLGLFIDLYGRKPFVILAGLTMALSLFLLACTKVYSFLILAYTLMNFSFIAEQPARGAMTAESVSEKEMGRAFGLTATPFFIARAIIPSISGLMADSLGFHLTFTAGGFLTSIGVIFFAILSIETLEKETRMKIHWGKALDVLKPRSYLKWFYIATMLDYFGWGIWFSLLNAYIYDVYGLTATYIGFLSTFIFSVTFLTQYLAGRCIDRLGYILGFLISELLGLMATLLLGVTHLLGFLFLSLLCIGLSISFWIPSFNNAISLNAEKENRAVEFSKVNTYRFFFSVPAPYIGGYIYDYISPQTTFLVSSTLIALTASLFYSRLAKQKKTHKAEVKKFRKINLNPPFSEQASKNEKYKMLTLLNVSMFHPAVYR